MYELKTVNEWKAEVMPAIISKKDEFHLLGYEKASAADIWSCMEKKVWKKDTEKPKRLYEVVADIMQLNISVYMGYLTMSVYEEDEDLMASIAAINGQS
ncbi:post-transcriptional regulator [Terribacillus halophilus]|uniref:post-transcriptional regulator n=1 Tax=Terribacillus halophilus TaxID=361279 RepID=UPI00117E0F5A|nr:post-transcriptional regulator [Terribacillus halophilus]